MIIEDECEKALRRGLAQLPRAADLHHALLLLVRNPYDLDILGALVSMNREAGHPKAALPYARKLAEVLPEDPAVKRLLDELEHEN